MTIAGKSTLGAALIWACLFGAACGTPPSRTRETRVPPAPLYRDPVFDGAADPSLIWNDKERAWWVFYTNRRALLLNGRVNNLEYGSYAPGAPDVFIDDREFQQLWGGANRYYLTAAATALPRLEGLVGRDALHEVAAAGGKYLFTNR